MSQPGWPEAVANDAERQLHRLRARRALARTALTFERVWPAIWPALGVAGLFVCLALLGLPSALPAWAHLLLLALFAICTVALLVRGVRLVPRVDDAAADRRLERASGLVHRPLAVLTDRPARYDRTAGGVTDPIADALWQAHVVRTLRHLRRLRVGWPRPGLARADRRALRGGLVVSLFAALVIAGADAPARLREALEPDLPSAAAQPGAQLQLWITPPPYTSLAPSFLKTEGGVVSTPAGAHLTASLTGGEGGPPTLLFNGRAEAFRPLDATSFQADLDLETGGRLEVRRNGRELAAWELTVIANQAPVVAWSEPPGPAARSLQTRLPWQAADDYGVIQLQAELRLRERPAAAPLALTIPIPGGHAKSAKGANQQDLTASPWAGLPVVARLVGRDAAGLVGASAEAAFVLPERLFRHPVARALIVVRKMLTIDPEDRASPAEHLDQLLLDPQALGGDTGAYLNLADIYYRLVRERAPEAVVEAQHLIWELALHLEEGGTERSARLLEVAREQVREALDRATQEPTQANRSEFDRRLKELEDAIRQHMDALTEQARRENNATPFDPDAQHLDSADLQRKAEAARDAARNGRMDDARQLMAELEQMLDQLRNARPEQGQGDTTASGKRQRGRQQMGALQDMISRQGGLLDHAQSRAEQPGDQRSSRSTAPKPVPGQPSARSGAPQQSGPGSGAPAGTASATPSAAGDGRDIDRRVQQALRRALGELMQQFGDLTGQVPRSLGDADQAMRDAGQALGAGQDEAAGRAQQQAIEALQKGGREMGQQMAKQFGPGQSGEGEEEGETGGSTGMSLQDGRSDRSGTALGTLPGQRGRGDKRDPLGRQLGQGTAGTDESDQVRVPEEMERQRTRAIQDELRRRGADRARPQPELDYIDRLLKQF